MLAAAFGASPLPLLGAAGALVILPLWGVRFPALGVGLLGVSVVVGQLGRFALPGQGGGLLPSDLAVLVVLVAALTSRPWPLAARRSFMLLVPFIAWSIFALVLSSHALTWSQLMIAAAYWARLATHLLLLPALLVLARRRSLQHTMTQGLAIIVGALALLGLLQLWFLPQLQGLPGAWDPHSYRLVSTWLDPNFVGALFAITLPWLIAHGIYQRPSRPVWLGLAVLAVVALLLTGSRSSLVALAVGALLFSPLLTACLVVRRPGAGVRALVGGGLAVTVITIGLLLQGERAVGLLRFDPTVTARLAALPRVWQVAADHALTGVGYNAYQFAAREAGLIGEFTVHSRAGADSSWLTLWVTTGIVGLALLLIPAGWIAQQLLRQGLRTRNHRALAALTGLVVWVIHSQFVNSLLYAHLLIAAAMLIAVAFESEEPHT